MPLPLLAIASGAVKVGQKIFGFFKKNKEKKAAKKQAKADQAKMNLATYNEKAAALGLNFGGATTITEGAAVLQNFMKEKEQQAGPDIPTPGGAGNVWYENLSPIAIGVLALVAYLVLKGMKILK